MRKSCKLIVLLAPMLSFWSCGNDMVKFKFVSCDYFNDKWIYDEDYPKGYDERLMEMLDIHDEKYLYKDGVLYIPKELYDYPGLLMNYCNEAASSMWADYGANLGKEAGGEE